MRILIAEDDTILTDGLSRALRKSGYAVDCVDTGTRADAALSAQTYDAVILDLGLPGISGFEVLKRLRSRAAKVPVLILTAADSVEQFASLKDTGAEISGIYFGKDPKTLFLNVQHPDKAQADGTWTISKR